MSGGRGQLQLCSLFDQRVHIFNETLYFVGGSYLDSSDIKPSSVRKLNKISLSSEFQVNGLINQTDIVTEDAPYELTDKDITNGGIFFHDDANVWAFGAVGRGDDIPTQVNQTDMMYRYDAIENKWSLDKIAGGEYQWFNNTNGFYATAPDGRNWYGGGQGIGTWGKKPGLLFFEGNSTTPKWSFIRETDDLNSLPTPSTLGGASVYLPIGEEGIIVLFGGWDTTKQGYQFAAGGGVDWDLRPLSDIFVYDIAQNFWTLVPAKGGLPEMRAEFCVVVNSAPDGSYHNIVLYGGWSQLRGKAYADVWVLSLPSFRWIKVEDENNPDTRPFRNNLDNLRVGDIGRTRHRCNLFKNTQMIVTGGIVSQYYDKKLNIDACNSSHPPFMVMDTSTFVWKASITPEEQDYSVPGVITSAVRGRNTPDGGWPNDRLGQIFSAARSSSTATPSSTFSAPNPTNTVPSDNGGLSIAGIAGIVVGGVVILALLIAGFIILRRRRKRSESIPLGSYDYFAGGQVQPKVELASNPPRAELLNHYHIQELPASPVKSYIPGSYHLHT
ncbi:uncharacterized protein DFL_003396 [Arthrobotrys flagrans]|uniref:Kelch repeat protein n=1 Tax=Arthrobotrys flagrans TaxID=97331 RepID=A0A437A1P9_ARTFL|nr:hypothetical protein DFL_003396 [Arthrobotrys flagrans]